MARMHRRSQRRRYERKIEHRQWFTNVGFHSSSITTSGTGSQIVKVFVDPLRGDDQTILRTRGIVAVNLSSLGQDAIGVMAATVLPNKTANNASFSELPNPFVDEDTTNWFVWHPFTIGRTLADSGSASSSEESFVPVNSMHIDSKAKRIMEASESVVWILGVSPQAAVSNKGFTVGYTIRSLVGY